MKQGFQAKALIGALLLPLLAFAFGQSVEVAHPIEEGELDPHHQHSSTASKDSLWCDSGPHAHHWCVHTTTLAAGFQPPHLFSRPAAHCRPLMQQDLVRAASTAVPLQRGPPVAL